MRTKNAMQLVEETQHEAFWARNTRLRLPHPMERWPGTRGYRRQENGIAATIEMSGGHLESHLFHPVEQDSIYEPLIADIFASIEVD